MKLSVTIFLTIAIPLMPRSLFAREWLGSSRKFKVETEFVEADSEQMTLKLEVEATIQVPLAKLSRLDRIHVAERLREIAENSLLPVVVRFNGPVANEPVDLMSDPQSMVSTSTKLKFNSNSEPQDVIINHTWNVASKQARVTEKLNGAVANYQPNHAKTVLYVSDHYTSLEQSFGNDARRRRSLGVVPRRQQIAQDLECAAVFNRRY